MQGEDYWTRAWARKLSRRQALKTGALAGLGLAAIGGGISAGCSSQESKPASTSSGSTTPMAGGPKRGGTLRYNIGADPPHMDVHTAENFMTIGPAQFAYSGLLKLDEKTNDDLTTEFLFTPDLAESYEQPQPDTFVFKLRKGVKFHNKPPVNGREFTAEDVKYNIERISTPQAQFVRNIMFQDVAKIETPDKYTVKFSLKRPSIPFLYNMASSWTLMGAKEVVDKDGDLKKTVIGTGPFTWEDYTRNVGIKFKRNPEYFLKDRPYLDGIDGKIITDSSTVLAAMRAKELDIGGMAYTQLESFKQSNPDAKIQKYPGTGKRMAVMHMDRPPFNDVRVRKALMYATDYQEVIELLEQGQGRQDGPLQWWLKPYALTDADLPKTDINRAKQLLAEAGYPNGFKVTATVSTTLAGVALGEVCQAQWKKVGVDVDLKVLEWGAWVNTVRLNKDWSLYFLEDWNYEDPDRWLTLFVHSKGPQNVAGYSNKEVDAILDKQAEVFNVQERTALFKEVQKKIMDDAAYIPLYTGIRNFVTQSYVKDYKMYGAYSTSFFFGGIRAWFDR